MTALFPTAYLPSVHYMACLSRYNDITIELKETFPKQTYRNRAIIATGNGLQMLTVPVTRPYGNHTRTEDIGISYQEPWHIRHWRAIVSAYNAAPYFLYYRDDLEQILTQTHNQLIDLNNTILKYLLKKLRIDCEISYTDQYIYATTAPTTQLPSYDGLSPITDFRTLLCVKHVQYPVILPPYSQVFDTRFGFQPNLTVLDLLFNLGPESIEYLQNCKEPCMPHHTIE